MRIAMLSELVPHLGSVRHRHVTELSAALTRLGHEVRVYTADDLRGLDRRPTDDRLVGHLTSVGSWLADTWRTGDWAPDVVHAHYWLNGLAAVAARRTHPVPVVQTYHTLGSARHRLGADPVAEARRIPLERALGHGVDGIVAQCRDEVRELIRLGVPRPRISVVPTGVDTDAFSPLGSAVPRHTDRHRILAVGRHIEPAHFEDVVRALPLVPRAEVVIVGGPPRPKLPRDPAASRLWDLARECAVDDRLHLQGEVPPEEMPRWYRSADVVAWTPWLPTFGVAPLEAMACGIPVVGAAVGGLPDTVVEGLTGDLVPPRNPRALGGAIRRLLADPIRRLGYGTAGADRARQCYSWERIANQLTAVYERVTGVPRSALAVG